ncbi:MAG TPA: hypothetical protein VGL35_06525 [Rhizomicrobium sp.]|jgi:hypothetical protein
MQHYMLRRNEPRKEIADNPEVCPMRPSPAPETGLLLRIHAHVPTALTLSVIAISGLITIKLCGG